MDQDFLYQNWSGWFASSFFLYGLMGVSRWIELAFILLYYITFLLYNYIKFNELSSSTQVLTNWLVARRWKRTCNQFHHARKYIQNSIANIFGFLIRRVVATAFTLYWSKKMWRVTQINGSRRTFMSSSPSSDPAKMKFFGILLLNYFTSSNSPDLPLILYIYFLP